MQKILYVSTRQWNPGDEFIQWGAQRVVEDVLGRPNVRLVYNKSPQVRSAVRTPRVTRWLPEVVEDAMGHLLTLPERENSFKTAGSLSDVDAVVFSSSPAWLGARVADLYRKISNEFTGMLAFLGIGTPNRTLDPSSAELTVLRGADVITCRDQILTDRLSELGVEATYLPCPALLSADPPFKDAPHRVQRIALVVGSSQTPRNQRISAKAEQLLQRAFTELGEEFECEVICHYVDEVPFAEQGFETRKVHYSYEAHDYPGIYREFDLVISTRVHGCGLASSLGIPSILIGHDRRRWTAEGFLAPVVEDWGQLVEAARELIDGSRAMSDRLKAHRRTTYDAYSELLHNKLL